MDYHISMALGHYANLTCTCSSFIDIITLMHRARTFFVLGIWIAVLPYLGFPYVWKNILLSISGILLSFFGYMIYLKHQTREKESKTFDNFSENQALTASDISEET
ncbi:MAG: hypothetical protein Q8O46_00220 [bacterium]|nr:hypothetical protein [bacterium]